MQYICKKCHTITRINGLKAIKCPVCGIYMEIFISPLLEAMKNDIRRMGIEGTWKLIEEKGDYKVRTEYRTLFFKALEGLNLKFHLKEKK